MRQFVVLGHDAPTTPEFSLDDLTSGAGRLDVLCRCVNAALFLSHGLRDDVRIHLVLADTVTVEFDGGTMRHLHPDERNIASRIGGALGSADEAIGHMPAEPSPGVSLYRMGFEATLDRIGGGTVIQLQEDGEPIATVDPPEDPVFVLSDHHDFTETERSILEQRVDRQIRVGPEILHADHAITIVHNYLDTDGYRSY